ncbi:hypothetical protein H2200_001828 [Cladophialophora chaetospira]|uniref:Uncharacterized protein n=1 Tax=Cladophialophora chaetospira TaxID=386627 RepID=A0AA38XLR8_9EURO|nr:hypothetical protein H2200_001828 [Cladophialophora chaetospira]
MGATRVAILLLAYWFYSTTAQSNDTTDTDYFLNPPRSGPDAATDPVDAYVGNLDFTVGVQPISPFSWVTNLTNMKIRLVQQAAPAVFGSLYITGCFDGTFPNNLTYWNGDIGDIDLSISNIAFLCIYASNCSDAGSPPVFNSHYFNLTDPTVSSSTSLPSSTSTSSTPTATPPATTSSAPVASPTGGSSGSSDAAAIGGGVGGGVGGAIILCAAAFAFWRYHKNSKAKQMQQHPGPDYPMYHAQSPGPPASTQSPYTGSSTTYSDMGPVYKGRAELEGRQAQHHPVD